MFLKPLSWLEPPEKGRIVRVGGRGGVRRRLIDMGVVSGTLVEVLRVAPLGDPVVIRVKGYDLALRRGEAEHIQVEPTEALLSKVVPGETVVVSAILAGMGLRRRLASVGISPGARLVVVNGGPGPVVVEDVQGYRVPLGRGMARKIMVSDGVIPSR